MRSNTYLRFALFGYLLRHAALFVGSRLTVMGKLFQYYQVEPFGIRFSAHAVFGKSAPLLEPRGYGVLIWFDTYFELDSLLILQCSAR